jgi:hypothetical protein
MWKCGLSSKNYIPFKLLLSLCHKKCSFVALFSNGLNGILIYLLNFLLFCCFLRCKKSSTSSKEKLRKETTPGRWNVQILSFFGSSKSLWNTTCCNIVSQSHNCSFFFQWIDTQLKIFIWNHCFHSWQLCALLF